jgi:hypothetical protein
MSSSVAALRQRAEDAERQAERFREMAEFAEKLGEEGIAEFVSMIETSSIHTNGNTNGNGHVHETGEKVPRGRKAVRLIVSERPGIWTLKQIRAEMEARDWFTSRKGVEVAASRLCADGEGKRIGRGRYMFPAEDGHVMEEVERESDPSDGALIPFDT